MKADIAFITIPSAFAVFFLHYQVQAGVQICCQCDAKSTKPFIDQIKEQFERQGGIQKRTVIGGECCDCQCDHNDEKWNRMIMVNEPGGCSINNLVASSDTKEPIDPHATASNTDNDAEVLPKIKIL